MSSESSTLFEGLFSTSAQAPDMLAFECGGAQLSYAEFEQQTLRLSGFLDSQEIEHQAAIAVLMPRSLEYTIAAYGTLYGGRILLPIDPALPVEMILQLLIDNNVRVLLTHASMVRQVTLLTESESPLKTIVGIEDTVMTSSSANIISWSDLSDLSVTSAPMRARADDIAYVIHTSGSTGRPKGIIHTHATVASFAKISMRSFGIESTDVIGSHGPVHTDMCTLGLFTGPLAGATTQIIPEAYVRVPASLSALMEKTKLTIWYSVPQVLVQLLTNGVLEKRDLSRLRLVIYAGEALAPSRIVELYQHLPNAQICNAYGPAETNVCTYRLIRDCSEARSLADQNRQVPIGDVWPETHALLLDKNDQPIQTDDVGELVIYSSTMMKGYQGSDKPFESVFYKSPEDGRTYYRTGDLARRDPSGEYILVGRRGRQIKIRGMRVELDSIELLLSQHPSVVDAVAIADNSGTDTSAIRAFVTQKTECTSSALYEYLQTQLPTHAMPESIQICTSIPLTSGGKIDRLRLSTESI